MKTTLNLVGVTRVSGIPEGIKTNASGRLSVGEKYRIIGFATVAPSTEIPKGWSGVAIEKLSTKGQIVVGTNVLLGTSIVLQPDGKYKVQRIDKHPFTNASEFAATDDEDNNTVFSVTDLVQMDVNVNIKLNSEEFDAGKHTPVKKKDFYKMRIEVAE